MPFCPKCGKEVPPGAVYCPSCGANLTAPITPVIQYGMKSPGVAAVLAVVFGLMSCLGIGHIYIGKIGKGITLLLIGWFLNGLVIASWLFWPILPFIIASILAMGFMILWIWSIYDAYQLAKYYNDYLQKHGKPPW